MQKLSSVHIWIYFLLLSLILNAFCLWAPLDIVTIVSREDSLVEWLSAGFFALAVGLGLFNFRHLLTTDRKAYLGLWILLSFVFMGEEASWFQRVFNYSVPQVEEINAQGEFNFHNIDFLMGNSTLETAKAGDLNFTERAKLFLKSSQNLFRIGFFSYFFVFPVLFGWLLKGGGRLIHWPTFDRNIFLTALLVILGTYVMALLAPTGRRPILIEYQELYYSMFICLYVCLLAKVGPYRHLSSSRTT